ncbi:hypothetical protein CMI45_02870 [Candidatus Pacearchaeota archaeon]|nr:hypothetical protein [Candidatus Pacearchaeota archaeon]|tara:strand:+ start:2478 stop:2945 length:468 start_codon:yes stop_codon:yes gene_type:complete
MINKRGLSDVITTVLIILLALVAVAIVWGFAQQFVRDTGESLTASCLEIQIEPTGCTLSGAGATAAVDLNYQWKAGNDLDSLRIVLSDGTESLINETSEKPSSILATGSAKINIAALDDGEEITATVVPVTKTSTAEDRICPAEGLPSVTCKTAA